MEKEDISSNPSNNRHFSDVVDSGMSRRMILKRSLAVVATSFFGSSSRLFRGCHRDAGCPPVADSSITVAPTAASPHDRGSTARRPACGVADDSSGEPSAYLRDARNN